METDKYILRTASLNKKKEIIADNFYFFEDYDEMLEKLQGIQPDYFECFEYKEITDVVKTDVHQDLEEKIKAEKVKLYEKLKKELGEI